MFDQMPSVLSRSLEFVRRDVVWWMMSSIQVSRVCPIVLVRKTRVPSFESVQLRLKPRICAAGVVLPSSVAHASSRSDSPELPATYASTPDGDRSKCAPPERFVMTLSATGTACPVTASVDSSNGAASRPSVRA